MEASAKSNIGVDDAFITLAKDIKVCSFVVLILKCEFFLHSYWMRLLGSVSTLIASLHVFSVLYLIPFFLSSSPLILFIFTISCISLFIFCSFSLF